MNIKSFKDIGINDSKKDKDKDKKKTTDSYTGGHSSGLNVENPDDVEGYSKQDNKLKLTVWKNGFQVDDGEFRDINKPENKKFMDEVEKGYIPKELVDKGMKNLGIMLEDKK
jgi:UBX domain-containing protein 1